MKKVFRKLFVRRPTVTNAPSDPTILNVTFAGAGAKASAVAKSKTGSVAPSGRSMPCRRIILDKTFIPFERVIRVARMSLGPGKT